MDSAIQSRKETSARKIGSVYRATVGEEVFNLRSESKTEEAISAYQELKSIPLAAIRIGVSEGRMSQILNKVRDQQGLSDVRFLYADSEDEFNTGTNDGKAVTQTQLMELLEQQDFKCALSGIQLTPKSAALDHITPVADNGTHDISNLQWLNHNVNRMKGRMSQQAFVEVCRQVARIADMNANMADGHPPDQAPGFEPS